MLVPFSFIVTRALARMFLFQLVLFVSSSGSLRVFCNEVLRYISDGVNVVLLGSVPVSVNFASSSGPLSVVSVDSLDGVLLFWVT